MKFAVHWAPSVNVCTPGWIAADAAGAHAGIEAPFLPPPLPDGLAPWAVPEPPDFLVAFLGVARLACADELSRIVVAPSAAPGTRPSAATEASAISRRRTVTGIRGARRRTAGCR